MSTKWPNEIIIKLNINFSSIIFDRNPAKNKIVFENEEKLHLHWSFTLHFTFYNYLKNEFEFILQKEMKWTQNYSYVFFYAWKKLKKNNKFGEKR